MTAARSTDRVDAPPPASAARDDALPPFEVPAIAALVVVRDRAVTTAHGGGVYAMQVAVSDTAAYRGEALPGRGFVACADHRVLATGEAGPLLCMRNEGGSWAFGVAVAGRWIRAGALEDCASCHATAERPPLFGAR